MRPSQAAQAWVQHAVTRARGLPAAANMHPVMCRAGSPVSLEHRTELMSTAASRCASGVQQDAYATSAALHAAPTPGTRCASGPSAQVCMSGSCDRHGAVSPREAVRAANLEFCIVQ